MKDRKPIILLAVVIILTVAVCAGTASSATERPAVERAADQTVTNEIPRTPDQLQWAKNFSVHGIAVGSTWADLKNTFPDLEPTVAGTNNVGIWRVRRERGLSDAAFAILGVMDGSVYSMMVRYDKDSLAKNGGWPSVRKRFQDNLGNPDSPSTTLCRWSIEPADLKFSLFYLQNEDSLDLSVFKPKLSETAHQRLLPRFEEAEAWNINIEKRLELADVASCPVFSRDVRNVLYVSGRQSGANSVVSLYDISLVIFSLEKWEVVKKISFPILDSRALGGSLACSPDGRKVAYGPVSLAGTNMFFVDLDNSKVIGVAFNQPVDGVRITWPNPTNIDVINSIDHPSYRIDLDTLQPSDLPKTLIAADDSNINISKHKNCDLDYTEGPFLGANDGAYRGILSVSSRQHSYRKVLWLLNGYMAGAWCTWSPDLRYVLIRDPGSDTIPPIVRLLKLGMRPEPILDFETRGLSQSLTSEQLRTLKNAFASGKRIWLKVFDRRINPLNGKLLGPDEGKCRGQGYLTQIEPNFKFRYSYEFLPAELGNILSSMRVDNGQSWGSEVWGELVSASDAADASSGTVKTNDIDQAKPQAQDAAKATSNDVSVAMQESAGPRQEESGQARLAKTAKAATIAQRMEAASASFDRAASQMRERGVYETLVLRAHSDLPTVRDAVVKAIDGGNTKWRILQETKTEPDTMLITMTGKQIMGFPRRATVQLCQLADNELEIRARIGILPVTDDELSRPDRVQLLRQRWFEASSQFKANLEKQLGTKF